jgi:predicted methyltransferase
VPKLTWTSAYALAARLRRRRDDLDQCAATLATVRRRLALLGRQDRDILLLGDDDLLGLALAYTEARSRITIVDADPRLIGLIQRYAPKGRLELVVHDLGRTFPRSLRGQFDEVFADPPYTVAGQLVFAHRASLALSRTPGATLFLCAGRVYLGTVGVRRVSRFLGRAGFATQRVHCEFNRYAAPPDVVRDLERLTKGGGRWLSSDLIQFVRRRSLRVPRLPPGAVSRMYDYASHPQP